MAASPTMIAEKVTLDRAALRGNLFPRVTELGIGYIDNIIQAIELLGIAETQKYLRICDAEREVIHRIAAGERIHGHKKITIIARLASTPTQKVSREDVLKVLR
jgi:hypothetical protein